jgi:hypothetical protein
MSLNRTAAQQILFAPQSAYSGFGLGKAKIWNGDEREEFLAKRRPCGGRVDCC